MNQSSLLGALGSRAFGVLLGLALAGAQPARAQTAAPADAAPAPAAAAEPAKPDPAPAAAKADTAKVDTVKTDTGKVDAAKPDAAQAAPEKPTRTAALPEVTKPAPMARIRASAETEQHISRLHAALKITPAQQPQWEAFAQVMRENAAHMESIAKAHGATAAKMNAVDGLKSYEEVTQAHLEDLQKLEPAFEALYGTMSESQKKSADAMFSQAAEPRKPKPAKAPAPAPSEQ